jgi:hypothetical protein
MTYCKNICVLLLVFSGFANAEDYRFGVEGWLTSIDNQDPGLINCDLPEPPVPYQVCYLINSDAIDHDETNSIGVYAPTNVTFRIGECNFISDAHLYEVKDDQTDGDEVFLGAGASIDVSHRWQIGVWAAAAPPSNFITSDAILPTAPDLELADVNEFRFDILPEISTAGSVNLWMRDAPFCQTVGRLITDLIADLIVMELPTGISQSLESKLAAVVDTLANPNIPNTTPAIKQLESIVQRVESMGGEKISEADVAYLVDSVMQIIDEIQ